MGTAAKLLFIFDSGQRSRNENGFLNRRRKNKTKLWYSFLFLLAMVTFGFVMKESVGATNDTNYKSFNTRSILTSGDSLVAMDNGTYEEEAKLPWESCSLEKNSSFLFLWLLLWALIIFWLFIGLAIICDDFFVPSLEEITDRLNLTEDVAGATFMAAGSSAPELFTSLSGVFVKSDVGIGTIVGSAIFNLLIIIALSAALAGKVLHIDWRPLSRDALFYSLSIVCFITFSWDGEISVYEALGLLGLYLLYVSLMFINPHLMSCMNAVSCCCSKVVPEQSANAADETASKSDDQDKKFRHTAQLNGLIRKMSVVSSASQSLKYKPTLAPLAIEEISELFEDGPSPGHNETAPPGKGDHPGQSPYAHYENETKHVVVYSAEMVEAVATAHGSDDPHSNGSLNNCPSGTRTRYDSNNCSQGTRRSSGNSQAGNVGGRESGGNSDQGDGVGGEGSDEDEIELVSCMPGIPIAFPQKSKAGFFGLIKYSGAWCLFVLAFPWAVLFAWTVPNCGKPHLKRYYLLSFVLSLFWIGVCSFAMVLLVGRTGCALNVQSFVMGLVIVAVGTSVPDALSSVIVARDGYGDMAVSNAIGSNVFDIDLGLGLPFLMRMLLVDQLKPIQLLSSEEKAAQRRHDNPMIPHVKFGFILFFILILCYLVFIAVRFRLNKFVGITFVFMYVMFIIYAITQEFVCDKGFAC